MKKTKRGTQGFTIVELLMYCAILTIFLLVMAQIFTSILDTQLNSESTAAVAQDSRYIMSRLAYDIGRATDVTVPALGASSNSLQLMINGSTFAYVVQSGNLELTTATGTDVLNSFGTTASNVNFRRFGTVDVKNNIQLTFTVTSNITKTTGPETRTLQTTIGLR